MLTRVASSPTPITCRATHVTSAHVSLPRATWARPIAHKIRDAAPRNWPIRLAGVCAHFYVCLTSVNQRYKCNAPKLLLQLYTECCYHLSIIVVKIPPTKGHNDILLITLHTATCQSPVYESRSQKKFRTLPTVTTCQSTSTAQ